MRIADNSLSKCVFDETHVALTFPCKEFKIIGMINRFGDFVIWVLDHEMRPIWDGTNILKAREFLLDEDGKVKCILASSYLTNISDHRRQIPNYR